MPHRASTPLGAPTWIDLFSSDTDAARTFYGELFDWTAEEPNPEFGGYFNFQKDGERIAGCMNNDGSSGNPDAWSVYLSVTDAKATEAAAAAHGGQVHVPTMEVGELGSMLLLADTGGAAIGAWQPGEHTGFKILAEDGAPAWFELHTREYDASVEFYRDVFGWDTHVASDTPEFRYTTFGEGDGQLAGIMDSSGFLPEGVPAHWAIYFGADDTDKSVAKAVELGATVVQAAEDTPYGRVAQIADPTGAHLRFVSVTP